ncbi:hypothetical protein GE21DRAFT_1333528 [Neurospora crassa]|nr:hypothetical protein GE21DRAFT_1333528 [Neurospora crassa]
MGAEWRHFRMLSQASSPLGRAGKVVDPRRPSHLQQSPPGLSRFATDCPEISLQRGVSDDDPLHGNKT